MSDNPTIQMRVNTRFNTITLEVPKGGATLTPAEALELARNLTFTSELIAKARA